MTRVCLSVNARSSAGNFDAAALKSAVAYCHARGVKVHVTLNTLVNDEELTEHVSNREDLRRLCAAVNEVLTPQEQQVIITRYGLGTGIPQRQREVAKLTGISRSYVSRIEKRALEKLRKAVEGEVL